MADAMGADDVVDLLKQNLDQEKKTLKEIEQATEMLSNKLAAAVA
jgi:ferritin-like metal-binding protein YciE